MQRQVLSALRKFDASIKKNLGELLSSVYEADDVVVPEAEHPGDPLFWGHVYFLSPGGGS